MSTNNHKKNDGAFYRRMSIKADESGMEINSDLNCDEVKSLISFLTAYRKARLNGQQVSNPCLIKNNKVVLH